MRVITLWQPWATLIALGYKKHETRSWAPTRIQLAPGDLLAIHAAAHKPLNLPELNALLTRHGLTLDALPSGCIVSIARYDGAQLAQTVEPDELDRLCGDWTPGRYVWKLSGVRNLTEPYPVRGRQGLWHWQPALAGVNLRTANPIFPVYEVRP